jgi:hypothetical protein
MYRENRRQHTFGNVISILTNSGAAAGETCAGSCMYSIRIVSVCSTIDQVEHFTSVSEGAGTSSEPPSDSSSAPITSASFDTTSTSSCRDFWTQHVKGYTLQRQEAHNHLRSRQGHQVHVMAGCSWAPM